MKVKIAKTYQAVEFGKSMFTYFSDRAGLEGLEMEAIPNMGIKISRKDEHAIVPFANVAFFKLADEQKTAKSPKKD